jgi:putative membrane protein insertion efficiency factor
MRRLLIALIRGYQYAISPLMGNHCRFVPSCSQYAADAIQIHGPGRGLWLALRRLARCHPWHAGGYDPVPRDPACCASDPATHPHPEPLPGPVDTSSRKSSYHG